MNDQMGKVGISATARDAAAAALIAKGDLILPEGWTFRDPDGTTDEATTMSVAKQLVVAVVTEYQNGLPGEVQGVAMEIPEGASHAA